MTKLYFSEEKITNDEFQTIFALGANFFLQGKYQKAKVIFMGLIALDVDDEKSAIALGEVYLRLCENKKALAHFDNIVKKFEKNARAALGAAKSAMLLDKPELARDYIFPIITKKILTTTYVYLEAQAIYKKVSGDL